MALGAPHSAGIWDLYMFCVYIAYTRADRPLQVLSTAGMCVVLPVDGYIFKRGARLETNPPGLCGFLGAPIPPRARSVHCVCGMDFFTSGVWPADTHIDCPLHACAVRGACTTKIAKKRSQKTRFFV